MNCISPEHQQLSLPSHRVVFLSNLIAIVGGMRDCHSSMLVKSPNHFCDNASRVVLVSLYCISEHRLQSQVCPTTKAKYCCYSAEVHFVG